MGTFWREANSRFCMGELSIHGGSKPLLKKISDRNGVFLGVLKDSGVEGGKVITGVPGIKPEDSVATISHYTCCDGPIEREHILEAVLVVTSERAPQVCHACTTSNPDCRR